MKELKQGISYRLPIEGNETEMQALKSFSHLKYFNSNKHLFSRIQMGLEIGMEKVLYLNKRFNRYV